MGDVPGMYWFVFWCAVVVIAFTMAWLGGRAAHQQKMKALEILRIYAERGVEPPASVAGPLLHSMEVEGREEDKWKQPKPAGPRPGDAFGFCFMALAAAAVAWWRSTQGNEPQWLFYGSIIVAVFSASGAISSFVNGSRRG